MTAGNEGKKTDYSLYLVTDRNYLGGRDLGVLVEQAVLGGVTVVQLREKDASSREFYRLALQLKEITARLQVPFIINDRLDIALAVDADGLHVGQEDLPLSRTRELLPGKIIGVSATTLPEALAAQSGGADYLGVGALFPTPTKTDASAVSLKQLEEIKKAVNIPVVAIGGINKKNLPIALETGVDGVAVVSAILAEKDVSAAAKGLRELLSLPPRPA